MVYVLLHFSHCKTLAAPRGGRPRFFIKGLGLKSGLSLTAVAMGTSVALMADFRGLPRFLFCGEGFDSLSVVDVIEASTGSVEIATVLSVAADFCSQLSGNSPPRFLFLLGILSSGLSQMCTSSEGRVDTHTFCRVAFSLRVFSVGASIKEGELEWEWGSSGFKSPEPAQSVSCLSGAGAVLRGLPLFLGMFFLGGRPLFLLGHGGFPGESVLGGGETSICMGPFTRDKFTPWVVEAWGSLLPSCWLEEAIDLEESLFLGRPRLLLGGGGGSSLESSAFSRFPSVGL